MDGEEGGIPLDYLRELHKGYMEWLESIAPRVQVVRLDWEKFGKVEDAWTASRAQWEERSRFTRRLLFP
jgi:hypothetical protein